MKTVKFTLLACLMAFSFFSCKKDCKPNPPTECPTTKWQGLYTTFGQPDVYVADSTFIYGGVAQLTHTPYYGVFYTGMDLPVPSSMLIGGDSVTFSARVKNPSNVNGAVFPFDVNLLLEGESNTGIITFIGEEINQQFNKLTVGNKGISNDASLLYLFEDWHTIDLKAKNNTLSVYRDGNLVNSIDYSGVQIGALKQVRLFFKGSGTVDWVKLTSSNTGTEIMHEDFNTNNESSAVWNCDATTHRTIYK